MVGESGEPLLEILYSFFDFRDRGGRGILFSTSVIGEVGETLLEILRFFLDLWGKPGNLFFVSSATLAVLEKRSVHNLR